MTCNFTIRAFENIQPETRKKIYFFFGPDDFHYSNDAHWKIASRHGEESCRSASFSFCKSVSEERFAHRREIRDSEKPRQRGLLKRPKIINTPSLGAFVRTSAFRPPVAYFNRRRPRAARHAAFVRNILSSRKSRENKDFFSWAFRLDKGGMRG